MNVSAAVVLLTALAKTHNVTQTLLTAGDHTLFIVCVRACVCVRVEHMLGPEVQLYLFFSLVCLI